MDLTKDLITLEALSGSFESADIFCEIYEKCLKNASKQGDFEQIRALKRILSIQTLFMVSQWLREEATLKEIEEAGEVQ